MKTVKKARPIQSRKVLNLCTIFRLAKPAFFRCNGKLHWKGFIYVQYVVTAVFCVIKEIRKRNKIDTVK